MNSRRVVSLPRTSRREQVGSRRSAREQRESPGLPPPVLAPASERETRASSLADRHPRARFPDRSRVTVLHLGGHQILEAESEKGTRTCTVRMRYNSPRSLPFLSTRGELAWASWVPVEKSTRVTQPAGRC